MPFGDPMTLFILIVVFTSAVLFLHMVGKEKDRRERHILMRYYEMEQEEQRRPKKKSPDEDVAKAAAVGHLKHARDPASRPHLQNA